MTLYESSIKKKNSLRFQNKCFTGRCKTKKTMHITSLEHHNKVIQSNKITK